MSLNREIVLRTLSELGYSKDELELLVPSCERNTPRMRRRLKDAKTSWDEPTRKARENDDHLSTFHSKVFSCKLGNAARPAYNSSKYKATGRGGCIPLQPETNPQEVACGPFKGLSQRRKVSSLQSSRKSSSMKLGCFYRESWKKNASVERLSSV